LEPRNTNQDIIVVCVFKAKYLSNGDYLEDRLDHNLSFIWRSNYASKVMVKEA
jgi:hypothetical protein